MQITSKIWNIDVLSLRSRYPVHFSKENKFWLTDVNVVWYMQAPIIIHFKFNHDKITHKSCSIHLQPKKWRMNRATSAKSIALLRPKMQIFKNKLSFNILVACYYIANSVDIKERETVESCQIYFITKLKIQAKYRGTCMITVSH